MKHNIRQRVINQYGLPVTKVESVNGELGSGIFDKNGKEIFEGDIVKWGNNKSSVTFTDGGFEVDTWEGARALSSYVEYTVVGHVEDGQL